MVSHGGGIEDEDDAEVVAEVDGKHQDPDRNKSEACTRCIRHCMKPMAERVLYAKHHHTATPAMPG